jgi:hypothetical protein
MMHILKIIQDHLWVPFFLFANAIGVCLIPLRLPGIWVQFAIALMASTLTVSMGLSSLPWWSTGIVLLLAIGGEIVDSLLGNLGFEKASGSSLANWLSFGGGMLFGLFGAILPIPIPVIGSLIGSVIMSFIGIFAFAILGEWIHRKRAASKIASIEKVKHLRPALRVGMGAVIGRALGVAAKLWFAFLAFGIVALGLLWDLFAKS